LQQQLEISELRELEDLIIDAIYQGIIQGQLDQKRNQLEVVSTMGRDLKPEAIDNMLIVLNNWYEFIILYYVYNGS
jgi:COP9 signalosome complex subunit 7